MDKTVLNLLFNYKGTISYREFRTGIIIVFISVGTYMSSSLISMVSSALFARGGSEWLAANMIYNQITGSFVPGLVPLWFIVSYSSFILALKRIRALGQNGAIGIISGMVNYLFFASLVALFYLVAHNVELQGNTACTLLITPALTYAILAFLLLGVINLLFLAFRRKTEQRATLSYTKGRLDISGYIIKLGNLMAVMAAASVVLGMALKLSAFTSSGFNATHLIIAAIYVAVPLFFYIKYTVYRLRDANVSILWLAGTVAAYVVLSGLQLWIALNVQNSIGAYYNTLFAVATSFYIALFYLLFLLPTNRKTEHIEEKETI